MTRITTLCCFLTLAIINTQAQEEEPISNPLISYSFDKETDDDGHYVYELKGSASILTLSDGNKVLSTGDNEGYLDMGNTMGREILSQLTGNYTITVDICVDVTNSLSRYCWVWAMANGTEQYTAMVNQAGNNNWYYEIKNNRANQAHTQTGLTTGTWHTLTAVQEGSNCRIIIDGQQKGSGSTSIKPSDFAASISQCWLGRSPFSGDAYMTNTYFDNFRIYNRALTTEQVSALYESRPTSAAVIMDMDKMTERMRKETMSAYAARYIHKSAQLPTCCSYGSIEWNYTEQEPGYVTLIDNRFDVVKRESRAITAGRLQGTVDINGSPVNVFPSPIDIVVAPDDNAVGYLYCHMPDMVPEDGTSHIVSQTITFALGKEEDNGLVFNELNGGHSIIEGIGTNLPWCRDAFLAKDTLRKCYYIVTTDLYGSRDNGTSMLDNYSIGMLKSYDLINWSYKRCDIKRFLTVNPVSDIYNNAGNALLTADKVTRVWAPQIIFINGDPYIYYAIGNRDNGDCDHFYISKANENFTDIKDLRLLYGPNKTNNILDADINYLETDRLYHMSYRDYERGDIRDITCSDLLHPEWNMEPITTFTDGNHFEASSVFRRINDDVWNVGNVNYGNRRGFHFHTADAMLRNLKAENDISGNLSPQHGSFVMVSQTEYDLLQTWSDLKGNIANAKRVLEVNNDENLSAAVNEAEKHLTTRQTSPIDLSQRLATLQNDLNAIQTALQSVQATTGINIDSIHTMVQDAEEIAVTNGSFDSGVTGWVTNMTPGTNSGVAEFFASKATNFTASISQTKSQLDNGFYLVTCQAFERNGYNDHSGHNYQQGAETINFRLFANNDFTDVASIYSISYEGIDNLYNYVNTMAGANNVFSGNPDNYLCGVVTEVTNGQLNFGISRRDVSTIHTSDWCCFDNFKVYRLHGNPTGIEPLTNKIDNQHAARNQIYNLNGIRLHAPQKGINIIYDTNGKVRKMMI